MISMCLPSNVMANANPLMEYINDQIEFSDFKVEFYSNQSNGLSKLEEQWIVEYISPKTDYTVDEVKHNISDISIHNWLTKKAEKFWSDRLNFWNSLRETNLDGCFEGDERFAYRIFIDQLENAFLGLKHILIEMDGLFTNISQHPDIRAMDERRREELNIEVLEQQEEIQNIIEASCNKAPDFYKIFLDLGADFRSQNYVNYSVRKYYRNTYVFRVGPRDWLYITPEGRVYKYSGLRNFLSYKDEVIEELGEDAYQFVVEHKNEYSVK